MMEIIGGNHWNELMSRNVWFERNDRAMGTNLTTGYHKIKDIGCIFLFKKFILNFPIQRRYKQDTSPSM